MRRGAGAGAATVDLSSSCRRKNTEVEVVARPQVGASRRADGITVQLRSGCLLPVCSSLLPSRAGGGLARITAGSGIVPLAGPGPGRGLACRQKEHTTRGCIVQKSYGGACQRFLTKSCRLIPDNATRSGTRNNVRCIMIGRCSSLPSLVAGIDRWGRQAGLSCRHPRLARRREPDIHDCR